MAMQRPSATLSPAEAKNLREFTRYAAFHWASNQPELSASTGISQPMISNIISGNKPGGGRTLRALSRATGISSEDILSGAGLAKLKTRGHEQGERRQSEERTRAAEALAKLYDMSFEAVVEIFEELGVVLPSEVSALTWFDVGRSAIERRKSGLALTRRLPP